jgi:uncharacterized lipoprotein
MKLLAAAVLIALLAGCCWQTRLVWPPQLERNACYDKETP